MTHASGPGDPEPNTVNETLDADSAPSGPGPEQMAAAAAALAEENAELKDRVLRMAADMENLRKRTDREKREASQYAIAGFAGDMLVVADNLSRAMASVSAEDKEVGTSQDRPTENKDASAASLATLQEGLRMTEHEFLRLLEKHGVRKIDPEGERFDPHQHQAMFEIPDETVPAGTVVQVAQTGFMIGERVLRPALVGVSKGGPKTKPAAQQADIDKAADEPQGGEPHIDKTV